MTRIGRSFCGFLSLRWSFAKICSFLLAGLTESRPRCAGDKCEKSPWKINQEMTFLPKVELKRRLTTPPVRSSLTKHEIWPRHFLQSAAGDSNINSSSCSSVISGFGFMEGSHGLSDGLNSNMTSLLSISVGLSEISTSSGYKLMSGLPFLLSREFSSGKSEVSANLKPSMMAAFVTSSIYKNMIGNCRYEEHVGRTNIGYIAFSTIVEGWSQNPVEYRVGRDIFMFRRGSWVQA